jgi:Malectin domain/EGF domain
MIKRLPLLGWVVLAACSSTDPLQPSAGEPVRLVSAALSGSVQIDCGSSTAVTPFAADEDFVQGATINHANPIDTSKVTNPAPAAVYQTARDGNFTYTISGFAAGSSAMIRLHFAETYFNAAGSRVFNVAINAANVLTNFDIIEAAGVENRAYIAQFTETANTSGAYVIQFTSVVNNSLVSGIEVIPGSTNSCSTNNGGCSPNATCTSTGQGTNSCACNTGYTGNGMACTPVNSCLTNNGGCSPNATCTDTGPGTNSCACNTGYTGNGVTCVGVDACATNNGGCSPNATCTSTGQGTNTCTCDTGYSGNGVTCTPVNSCLTNNGGCSPNATCTSTGQGTNTCTCDTGYSGNGVTCTPVNSCQTNNGGCPSNSTCNSVGPGINTCTCNTGFVNACVAI